MKKITLVILSLIPVFMIPVILMAQTPHQHEKKVFVDEDEKIYWNKSLPVYIRLAVDPEGESYLMKSDTMPEYTEPFYFDTEGPNFIRTRWAVDKETGLPKTPQEEILWDVYADSKPPVTNAEFDYSGKVVINGRTFYSRDLTIKLNTYDEVSGVEEVYYSLNKEPFKKYEGPIKTDLEQAWFLAFYAVDRVGNSEADTDSWKTSLEDESLYLQFEIDDTPPVTRIHVSDPKFNDIVSPKAHISFTSEDEASGVEKIHYRLIGDKFYTYRNDLYLSEMEEGDYTISWYAVDNVKNQEDTQSYSFFLDRTAPEINYAISGDHFEAEGNRSYVSVRSEVVLSGTDEKAGLAFIHYKIDGNSYEEYSSPMICDLKQGIHYVSFYGQDKVENKSKVQSRSFIVDTDAPVISYKVSGPEYERKDTVYIRDISEIQINPYEKGSYQSGVKNISYFDNDGSEVVYNEKFTLSTDGFHNLKLKVTDQVNNVAEKEVLMYADNTAPEIYHHFSVDPIGNKTILEDKLKIYASHVKVYLAATDKEVGTSEIYYSLNGGPEKLYEKPIEYLKSGVNFDIKVRALDHLGNESEDTIRFAVEDYTAKK